MRRLSLRRNQPAPKEEEDADPLADLAASLAGDGRDQLLGLTVKTIGDG